MTIQQLLEELSKYPPSMQVVVDGYEGGYDDPTCCVKEIAAIPPAGRHEWYGKYDDKNGDMIVGVPVTVICLSRYSNPIPH